MVVRRDDRVKTVRNKIEIRFISLVSTDRFLDFDGTDFIEFSKKNKPNSRFCPEPGNLFSGFFRTG